jgi:S-adenosylmethionine hydrolase
MNAPIVTLTSDFGERGGYVGIMKGVIYARQPAAIVVDITHQVTPQAIREGAFLLQAAYRYFPPGTIHVAVVDPGVGTARRALCLDAPGVGRFVGPDNGLFSAILDAHPDLVAREIANPAWLRRPVSPTFHGRDVFAPVAATLAGGAPIAAVGPLLDPAGLVRLDRLRPDWVEGPDGAPRLAGEVVHIDHFGTLVSNLAWERFAGLDPARLAGARIAVLVGTAAPVHTCAGIATTYGDGRPGDLLALFGGGGHLEIARVNGRADRLARGRRVPLGAAVEVSLGR